MSAELNNRTKDRVLKTPWLELLEVLRPHLIGRDHRGKRGSLRWLEQVMAERGGRSGAVRNILYKDLGSHDEKTRLFQLFCDLYQEAGLAAPGPPETLTVARARRFLGRDKRLIFARFSREVSEGKQPQLLVVGGPATGKGVLLEQVQNALPKSLFLNLAQDLSAALFSLCEKLGVSADFERLMAQFSPAQPYALNAALQEEMLSLLIEALNQADKPLLLRAEAQASLGALLLRDKSGREVALADWLEPLFQGLKIPFLAALSSAPPQTPYKTLRPPSRKEALSYLRQRLPEASPEKLEQILNRAGRNYGELSRLALFEMSRAGTQGEARLQRDPQLAALLKVLAVLSPEVDPALPVALFERALGRKLGQLSQAERLLIELLPGDMLRPALRSVLPTETTDPQLHTLALDYYKDQPQLFRRLYHAQKATALTDLVELLEQDPSRLALMPGLWPESTNWPAELRERLAFTVVRYRSVLGDYAHPEAQTALEFLMNLSNAETSAWARVKIAEAQIDAGHYEEAETLTKDLLPLSGEAKAEALLVKAALARWRGAYDQAEAAVRAALDLSVPPLLLDRVRLWQGLVAKDAGRFTEALARLKQVRHNPLLAGRARYQEGDLLMRLGRPEEGAARITKALEHFETGAAKEEQARVRARLGTALRRAGQYYEADKQLRQALSEAPDPFTRARIQSEAAILEAAKGHPWEALQLAGEAESFFRKSRTRPEEASYRHQRSLYRLAVAYWVWEVGEPYRPPYRGGGQSLKAQSLLELLLEQVKPLAGTADRYASLCLDITAALALMLPADEACALLQDYELANPYLSLQAQLAFVEALIRANRASLAAGQLAAIRKLPPDPGLRAWKAALEAEMLLMLKQPKAACEVIEEALALPKAFRVQLGRVWGRVLLQREQTALAMRWLEDSGPFALPEALALSFGHKR